MEERNVSKSKKSKPTQGCGSPGVEAIKVVLPTSRPDRHDYGASSLSDLLNVIVSISKTDKGLRMHAR